MKNLRSALLSLISISLLLLASITASQASPANPQATTWVYLPTILRNYNANATGNVFGKVLKAIDKTGIQGADVCLGAVCTITNSAGEYSLTLPPTSGALIASAAGYFSVQETVTIVAGQAAQQDFILVNSVNLGEEGGAYDLTVLLQWNATSSWPPYDNDLDLHLWEKTSTQTAHIFYENKFNDLLGFPFAIFRIDETNGLGPETIDINFEANYPISYYFAVDNVNQGSSRPVPPIQNLEAAISLYTAQGPKYKYRVEDNHGCTQENPDLCKVWYAFKWVQANKDATPIVTTINCLTEKWAGFAEYTNPATITPPGEIDPVTCKWITPP